MKRNYSISVAMATYNGEKYIKYQLESILKQLNANDEIVISDDGSSDNTIKIINKMHDKRIKIIKGPSMGVKQNFANALSNCSGNYIFLSDQDDIWIDDKIDEVLKQFEKNKNITCILHDCLVFDSSSGDTIYESYFKYRRSKTGLLNNIIKNSYIGCCMAFDKKTLEKILPIPDNIEMHDQWIGEINEIYGKTLLLNKKLIKYRRHTNNVSNLKHYGILKMIKNRVIFIIELIKRKLR